MRTWAEHQREYLSASWLYRCHVTSYVVLLLWCSHDSMNPVSENRHFLTQAASCQARGHSNRRSSWCSDWRFLIGIHSTLKIHQSQSTCVIIAPMRSTKVSPCVWSQHLWDLPKSVHMCGHSPLEIHQSQSTHSCVASILICNYTCCIVWQSTI